MDAVNARLSRQVFEMAMILICSEIYNSSELCRNLDMLGMELLETSSDESDEDDDDLLYLALLKQAHQLTSDEDVINAVHRAYMLILSHPASILRPYQSHMRTDSGTNRIQTRDDLLSKFGVEAQRILRFSVSQLDEIVTVLQIPDNFIFCGHHCTGIEALVISLHRMSSHVRFIDLSYVYDLLPSFLSQIFAGFMLWIYSNYGDIVRSFEHPWTTDREWLELFAEKLSQKGCPLPNCFGFIDGTHIEVCRPVRDQRSWYCGHHHTHCFKCLVIQLANGMLLSFGPFNGSQHDSSQAEAIQIGSLLSTHCSFPDRDFVLYADSGFAIGQNLITPFRRGRNHSDEEAEWNREMSRHRITVEWGIGRCKNLFQMMNNKNNLKSLMSPVAIYWFNSILFTNIHSCINRRNQVSEYFDLDTPTLEEYIRA